MTDRELLELAAKACGFVTSRRINAERLQMDPPVIGLWIAGLHTNWNPLDDSGAALDMAVALNLVVRPLEKCVFVESNPETLLGQAAVSELEMYANSDPRAATRRAIVRAAASITTLQPEER